MRPDIGAALRLRRKQRAQLQIGTRSIALHTQGAAREQRTVDASGLGETCAAVRASLAAHPGLAIDVRLVCAWSHLLLLPWVAQLTREDRWQNYARARFEQVYGESAEAWDIRLARDWPGRDRLAVAWPAALREEIATHRNVRSVRIGLLEHLGVLLAREPAFSGCIAEIEPDGAGFLFLVAGHLRRARWSRFEDAEGLATAMRAEWASIVASEAVAPGAAAALALTPPAPQPASDRARTVAALADALGIRRVFTLPEWA